MFCDRARVCGPKRRDRTHKMKGIGDWLALRKRTPQESVDKLSEVTE
jgi:hypothetical protein